METKLVALREQVWMPLLCISVVFAEVILNILILEWLSFLIINEASEGKPKKASRSVGFAANQLTLIAWMWLCGSV